MQAARQAKNPPDLLRRAVLGAALALPWVRTARAAGYPGGPVHFVVPFTAGSGSDLVARIFGERLAPALAQPVTIDNRPGAGGTIAAALVAKAPADGLTLAIVGMGHLVNPVLYKNLPYDTLKDFVGVAPLAGFPNVLVVSPALGIKSMRELVALAKSRPGKLNWGSAGIGSGAHINMQKMLTASGIEALHIPLKGANEILTETASGRCHFSWAPLGSSMGMIEAGKLTALAVSSVGRAPLLPDTPTVAEAGYPGAECNVWIGLLAPAATPMDIVVRLNAEARSIGRMPVVKERLARIGAESMSMSPEQFGELLRSDYESLGRVMRDAT